MVHNTCPYCHSDTVMVKDHKSRRWHACTVGTTARHRCAHWDNVGAQTSTRRQIQERELDQQLAVAADDGWPNQELHTRDREGAPQSVAP
jgi:hypothetical protein